MPKWIMTTQSLLSETPVGPLFGCHHKKKKKKKSKVTACSVFKNLILSEMMCMLWDRGYLFWDCQLNLSDKNDFMTN